MLQLVTEHTSVALTRTGITNVDTYDPKAIDEKYGLVAKQIIDLKGLMGDSSDNIPGVPGVGEKTALKLLKQFGTIENVLDSVAEVSGKKLKERLEEHKDQALMSKELATIYVDIPYELKTDELAFGEFDKTKVVSLFKELGFSSLIDRFDDEAVEKQELEALKFEHVTHITEELFASPSALMVEVLEENYHTANILGFALANEHGHYYLPTELALQSTVFQAWAKDDTQKKVGF